MQYYELLFILPGTLAETEGSTIVDKVKALITENGGSEITAADMGKNRLAYPMKHIRYGYFHIIRFAAVSEDVVRMKEKIRLLPNILRLILNRVDPSKKPMTTKIDIVTDVREARMLAQQTDREARGVDPIQVSTPAQPTESMAVASEEPVKETNTKAENIKLEDIDKKLDELLESDIANV